MSGRTAILSTTEREQGFAFFLKHITWNGFGVFLLNNTVVSLMAIHFGASNLELGYINAAFHVTGVVSLVVPRLFRGRRINRIFGWSWLIRGFVAGLYGVLLVLSGPVARATIIVIFTGFCISRAVGVSVAHAVQRDVMRDREVAGGLVRLNIRLGYAQLLSQLLSFGLLSVGFFSGIAALVTIAYIGVVMNTVASLYLLRIPGRSVVEHSTDGSVLHRAFSILRHRRHLVPMLLHCLGMGLHVLFAFQVIYMRRVLGFPDSIAVFFTLVGAVAAIFANNALKPFADSIGEKPLLVITTAALGGVALVWAIIPATLPPGVYFGLGFVTYFFLRSLLTLKAAALIKSIPERDRIPYTSTANVLLGVVALAVGLIGGALADMAPSFPAFFVHEYSLTFVFAAVVAVGTMILSMNLPEGRSLSLRETADIMLSVRNLRAFLDGNQLDFVDDPARREGLLLSLERSTTPIATSRLRQRLRGPSVAEKERVLRILFRSPRIELLDDIVAEARDPGSYTRREAIFCLGSYTNTVAEQVLREIVAHTPATGERGDEGIKEGEGTEDVAVALKSLARHTCFDVLPEIRRQLESNCNARVELDLAVAEAILDPQGPQLGTLFERAFRRESKRFAVTRLVVSLDRLYLVPELSMYLRTEAMTPGRGFSDLLEDALEFESVHRCRSRFSELAAAGDFVGVWEVLQELFRDEIPLNWSSEDEKWVPLLATAVSRVRPAPSVAAAGSMVGLFVLCRCLEATTRPNT